MAIIMRRRNFYTFIIIIFVALTVAGGWFVALRQISRGDIPRDNFSAKEEVSAGQKGGSDPPLGVRPPQSEITENMPKPPEAKQSILLNVPFASQAPSADWDNVIFQQGCEEASMLMAMLWVENKSFISAKDAEKAIFAISNFSQKNYGEFRDTSAADTANIMKDYFQYEGIEVKNNITAEDIKAELVNGNLVIVPVNGQKLGNPFYTPPGPFQHMLVVKGYDTQRKEFITNDPGTRRGEGFRYKENVLDAALRDYPTGYKEQIVQANKAMIVVEAP